jgi:hypothetical protein
VTRGRHRAEQLVRTIIVAGLLDSLGLSLGWAAFTLITVTRDGLVTAGLYNAAMLIGMVASAPVTSWLAHRLGGRGLLAGSGAVELVLRVGSLAALLAGWPPYLVAALVAAMNVATWCGYAGMRAEIGAVAPDSRSMTHYAVAITAIEAVGTGLAGALPLMSHGRVDMPVVVAVAIVYGASLLPQFRCAARSRVRAGRSVVTPLGIDTAAELGVGAAHSPVRRSQRLLVFGGGGLIMLVASGPATLSTALGAELGGRIGVVVSAAAVCLGSLAATAAVASVERLRVPLRWPLLGAVMVAGWAVGPAGLLGLLVAQATSALALVALQGDMDSVVVRVATPGRVTAHLAWSTAIRAGGAAIAARVLPLLVTAQAIAWFATPAAALLLAVVGVAAAPGMARSRRAPQPTQPRSGRTALSPVPTDDCSAPQAQLTYTLNRNSTTSPSCMT